MRTTRSWEDLTAGQSNPCPVLGKKKRGDRDDPYSTLPDATISRVGAGLMPPGTVGVHPLELIRSEVRQRLAEFGAPVGDSMAESCLLQDNSYCGRRFTLGGFQAVWFLEENEVKFYAPSGELLGGNVIGKAVARPQEMRRAA